MTDFLNNYIEQKNEENDENDRSMKEQDFLKVINFVNRTFPEQGFAKAKGVIGVSKPYFEAIALGALFALKDNENLSPKMLNGLFWIKNILIISFLSYQVDIELIHLRS